MDTSKTGGRHPWLAEFEQAPVQAFGNLLRGYAAVFPYDRADAPDAVRMLFEPLPSDDPIRGLLDEAVVSWLERRRRDVLPSERPKLQRAVREIGEAFEIVATMALPNAARALRQRFVVWNEWAARFVLSPARDAQAEYWRMLALTQPLLRKVAPEIDVRGLGPLWFRICREAGGCLPRRYLEIGLLGLRRLPEAEGGIEVPWLAGLAQWAVAQEPSEAEFKTEWFALKALYPRAPKRWRALVLPLLSALSKNIDLEAPAWWAVDPDFKSFDRSRAPEHPLLSPMPQEAFALVKELDGEFANVEPKIDSLILRHRRFVEQTGDARYFVRAVHVLGRALIKRENDESHRLKFTKAQVLVQEGLAWEPRNRFLWALWQEALLAEGCIEAAELVGWEKLRRVPTDEQGYVQVANTIALLPDRRDEAESLLRQAITRFPHDAPARTSLAEILVVENRLDEAMALLNEMHVAGMANEPFYSLLARLHFHQGDKGLARDALSEGLEHDPNYPVLRHFEDLLDRGQPIPLVSRSFEQDSQRNLQAPPLPATSALSEAMRGGRVRRIRFRLETETNARRDDALSELRRILGEDPTFAYAELLAARQGIWEAEGHGLPGFASAFEDALRTEDRAMLEQLAQKTPRLKALILVAQALFGDEDAAHEIAAWLEVESAAEQESAVAVLRTQLRPVYTLIEGGLSTGEAFAKRRQIVISALHDANEAGVGSAMLLAA